MGRRGPAKEPVQLRVLKGETRPSRINRAAPQPTPADPNMPADLDERAQQVWQHVMANQAPGVIVSIDRDGLRIYAEAVSRYEQASKMLATTSPLVRGQRGEMVRNPLHQIMRDNADLVKVWARELGLSPAARAGLTMPDGGKGEDAHQRFFGT